MLTASSRCVLALLRCNTPAAKKEQTQCSPMGMHPWHFTLCDGTGRRSERCRTRRQPPSADADCWIPSQIDYRERLYAVGRIPTSSNRSEGAPRDREWLVMRSLDSALRPLLDVSVAMEVQVMT